MQILYCKGQEIGEKEEVKLHDKCIIHVKIAEENKESIKINVIKYMPQKKNIFKVNFEVQGMEINLSENIEDFLKRIMKDDASA